MVITINSLLLIWSIGMNRHYFLFFCLFTFSSFILRAQDSISNQILNSFHLNIKGEHITHFGIIGGDIQDVIVPKYPLNDNNRIMLGVYGDYKFEII